MCLVLHGASATTADYERFGFAQFLTAAVQAGAPPFVLAGADGGRTRWAGDGDGDDPQRMLIDELPAWCDDHGFDTSRLAAYGWSMGGYGALLTAIRNPGLLRGVAALSPAVGRNDEVANHADDLDPARTAVWCGTADSLYDAVRDMARASRVEQRSSRSSPATTPAATGTGSRRPPSPSSPPPSPHRQPDPTANLTPPPTLSHRPRPSR